MIGQRSLFLANIFGNVKRCFSCNLPHLVFVTPSENVMYSVSLLSFWMKKSSACTVRCSYLPRNPKCSMKSYRCVFIRKRGEWQPNWPHTQTSSLNRLQFLFSLLQHPTSQISTAFPSRVDRDLRWWKFSMGQQGVFIIIFF